MRLMWAVLFVLIAAPSYAQQPVWVFLKPAAVQKGPVVTGARARVAFDNDRAIPAALIKKLERTGAHTRYTSRWLQAVSMNADARAISKLKKLREVVAVTALGTMVAQDALSHAPTLPRSHAPIPANPDFDSTFYGGNWKAIKQLGVPSSHVLGFTGKNVKIAILDTGFEPAHEAVSTRQLIAQRDFINRDSRVSNEAGDPADGSFFDQEMHGTGVWSILGGYAPGKVVGPAFDARFILAKVDVNQLPDTIDFKADEDRWVAAVEWADSLGADVISSSLAYKNFLDAPSHGVDDLNGNTTLAARMADEAARRGILVVNAMGNFGPEPTSLWTPADADSIISVGAVDSLGQPAVFSATRATSRGPTADGRLKPELSAPGKGITAANSVAATSYFSGSFQGTSAATPFISGIAAMFMQAWPNLTIMAVRNALMLAGSRADFPDNNVGFGVPNISSAILFPEGLIASGITGVNLENELTTIQPQFTWTAPLVNSAMRPVKYRMQIATDPTFSNVIYEDTTDGFSLTMKQPLRPAPALWWRVIGEAFPNITRTTRVGAPFVMPDWVRLLTLNSPSDNFTDSIKPVLRWEPLTAPPPSGPLSYDVQILNAQTLAPIQTIANVMTASIQPTNPLTPNVSYRWRVIAKSPTGVRDTVTSQFVFVVTSNTNPPATLLYQNFPNPFGASSGLGETSTRVWFDVTTPTRVELAVYDLRGRLVRQLIPNTPGCGPVLLEPGQYGRSPGEANPCVSTVWDARDARGVEVRRGVYILRLRAGGVDQVKKILYTP